jgi:hypothetical protein
MTNGEKEHEQFEGVRRNCSMSWHCNVGLYLNNLDAIIEVYLHVHMKFKVWS